MGKKDLLSRDVFPGKDKIVKNRYFRYLLIISLLISTVTILVSACSSQKSALELTGQSTPASDILIKAIDEVQGQIDRHIKIYDLAGNPDPTTSTKRGITIWKKREIQIWLNPDLKYDDQEAVAAHELAHIAQGAQGYCRTATLINKNGERIFPTITDLGAKISSMIQDVQADSWAAERGFKVEEGLKLDALPRAIESIQLNIASGIIESTDWTTYQTFLSNLAQKYENGDQVQDSAIPSEIITQKNAVMYANFKCRLARYGLFNELDELFSKYYPKTREMGIEISKIVEENGTGNAQECNQAIVKVIEYLKIPPVMMSVRNPETGEIYRPKTS
jgi:hypothetical protein